MEQYPFNMYAQDDAQRLPIVSYEVIVDPENLPPQGMTEFDIPTFAPSSSSIIFVNGQSLSNSEYTVSGNTVTLATGLFGGDSFKIIK